MAKKTSSRKSGGKPAPTKLKEETPTISTESVPPAGPAPSVPEAPQTPAPVAPFQDPSGPANAAPAPTQAADAPVETAFPPELASPDEPQHRTVDMPPVSDNAFANVTRTDGEVVRGDKSGTDRDLDAALAVAAGQYRPGVVPPIDPAKERIFKAPDGVMFAGPKGDDIFKDPRNGRYIRPDREGARAK